MARNGQSDMSQKDPNQYVPLHTEVGEEVSPAAQENMWASSSSTNCENPETVEPFEKHNMNASRRYFEARGLHRILEPQEVPSQEKEYNKKLTAAKMVVGFAKRQSGYCTLDTDSVYGAAILMPQLARTAGWEKFLTFQMLRSYIFLIANVFVQGYMVYFVAMEERVMDSFAGQMFLCDFGVQVDPDRCPGEGLLCMGPGGTEISPSRVYNYAQWSTRNFVKDSLKLLFPDRRQEIESKVDPGEYGVEAYNCRLLCCFIFIVSVMNDLIQTLDMLRLLYHIPTANEDWFEANDDTDADTDVLDLDNVKVKVAGMPLHWKFLNVVLVLCPKLLIWRMIAQSGIMFLMETSSIEDVIINSVGMGFLLHIDEMMYEVLMPDDSKALLQKIEGIPAFDAASWKNWSNDKVLEEYANHDWQSKGKISDLFALIPVKLLASICLTFLGVYDYYSTNCIKNAEGGFVSQDMYLPKSTHFSFMSAFFPGFFPEETQEEAFWSMPNGD